MKILKCVVHVKTFKSTLLNFLRRWQKLLQLRNSRVDFKASIKMMRVTITKYQGRVLTGFLFSVNHLKKKEKRKKYHN